MPAVGGIARLGLPPAGRDQRGRLHDHGADRSAISGATVLRLAADGGMAGDPGPCRQPQTGPASDAARRPGGDLSATEHEQAGGSPQDLPLPARRDRDRAGQSGLELGRHLHPDGQGLPLPSGDHGLGEPCLAWRLSNTLGAEYASVAEAKAGIGSWLGFYNEERQHQSLGYRTPRQAYEAECPWICGRSASPTGGAFAHIPTGATANYRIDIDEAERSSAMTVAPGAIGAGTEIGRATP